MLEEKPPHNEEATNAVIELHASGVSREEAIRLVNSLYDYDEEEDD